METIKDYASVIIGCFVTGILFCAFYNQWILITLPFSQTTTNATTSSLINKKQTVYHYFHHDKWKSELQEQLWTETIATNLNKLINTWLTILDEENIVAKKTVLQSALVSRSGTAYLSFDHTIFSKEDSIFKKWMILEGLLMTIRTNNIPIQEVQFLVQHQQLNDPHLDFSMPWPINGFMK